MRYFIGLGLPYELQEKVTELRGRWHHYHLPDVRFPHGVQPHVTIKSPFETDRTDWIPAIGLIMKEVQSFELSLTGIDAFDGKVIHMQVAAPKMADLNQACTGALRDMGLEDDADLYPYTAHSTLAYAPHKLHPNEMEKIRHTAIHELGLPQTFLARKIQIFGHADTEEHYGIIEEFELLT
jgi:2'-5' RNA ligase